MNPDRHHQKAVKPGEPGKPRPWLVIDGVDLGRADLWEASLGYQWGTTHGIDLGRQELAAEERGWSWG